MTVTASSALAARSSPRRTRSMPIRAGGAGAGRRPSRRCSLPIATPCSFTPCSKPHSQSGREPSTACAPASSSSRYCVRTLPPAGRRANASTTCGSGTGRSEFLANSVRPPPTTHSVSHTTSGGGELGARSAAPTAARPSPPRSAGPSASTRPAGTHPRRGGDRHRGARRCRRRAPPASPAAATRPAPRTGSSGSRRARPRGGSSPPSRARAVRRGGARAGTARRGPTTGSRGRRRDRRTGRVRTSSSRAPSGRTRAARPGARRRAGG